MRQCVLCKLLLDWLLNCQPKKLTIHPKGCTMSFKPLSIGQTAQFTVVATNAEGQPVPDTGISATSDNPTVATATCNPDGTGGVVTAVALGTYNVTSTDGTLVAAPVDGTVVDLTPTTLTITPA